MRVSKAIVDNMPRLTRRQEDRRGDALRELRLAQEMERDIERGFSEAMAKDGSNSDRDPSPDSYVTYFGADEVRASGRGVQRLFAWTPRSKPNNFFHPARP